MPPCRGRILTSPGDDPCHAQAMDEPMPVEFLLDGYPDAIRESGMSLRALIFRTVPGTVETIHPGWRWIAYSLPEGRRIRNFASIGPESKHIHLGFEHGRLLEDPESAPAWRRGAAEAVSLLHLRAVRRHRSSRPRRLSAPRSGTRDPVVGRTSSLRAAARAGRPRPCLDPRRPRAGPQRRLQRGHDPLAWYAGVAE